MTRYNLEVEKLEDVPDLKDAFLSLNFDVQGKLLLSWSSGDGSACVQVIGEDTHAFETQTPRLSLPTAQRFTDGRWVLADVRCKASEKNAHLFSSELEHLRSFHIGDAIEHLRVDRQDQIWVGYFDENPLGLRSFTDDGRLTYDFNQSSGLDIFDLYALHLDTRDRVWVYPYTEFFLASIENERVDVLLKDCPVAGSKGVLIAGTHVAFLGRYESSDAFVYDINSQKGLSIGLTYRGKVLGLSAISTYGDTAAFHWDGAIYAVTLRRLIETFQNQA